MRLGQLKVQRRNSSNGWMPIRVQLNLDTKAASKASDTPTNLHRFDGAKCGCLLPPAFFWHWPWESPYIDPVSNTKRTLLKGRPSPARFLRFLSKSSSAMPDTSEHNCLQGWRSRTGPSQTCVASSKNNRKP